jgi:hypothetical protein
LVYEYIWEWEGKTQQNYKTYAACYVEHGVPTTPPADLDPFLTESVAQATKTTILSELSAIFTEEMAKKGISATITLIEPEAWVERTIDTAIPSGYQGLITIWYSHWLHMHTKVHFNTDKPLTESPIDPSIIATLTWILSKLLIPLAIAISLIIVAVAVGEWVKSWGMTHQTITTVKYNPATGETTTITEDITQGAGSGLVGGILTAVVILGGLGIGLYFLTKTKGKGRRR